MTTARFGLCHIASPVTTLIKRPTVGGHSPRRSPHACFALVDISLRRSQDHQDRCEMALAAVSHRIVMVHAGRCCDGSIFGDTLRLVEAQAGALPWRSTAHSTTRSRNLDHTSVLWHCWLSLVQSATLLTLASPERTGWLSQPRSQDRKISKSQDGHKTTRSQDHVALLLNLCRNAADPLFTLVSFERAGWPNPLNGPHFSRKSQNFIITGSQDHKTLHFERLRALSPA